MANTTITWGKRLEVAPRSSDLSRWWLILKILACYIRKAKAYNYTLIIVFYIADDAVVAILAHNQKVGGSNPPPATKDILLFDTFFLKRECIRLEYSAYALLGNARVG